MALIVAFFLPLVSVMGIFSVSSFETVFGSAADSGKDASRFLLLVFPLAGILLLIGALNNEKYIVSRKLLAWLPLATIIGIIIYIIVEQAGRSTESGGSIMGIFDLLGIGAWLTLVVSLVLPFANFKTPQPAVEAEQ